MSGRVALHGPCFDSGKAEAKPESECAPDQIAELLAATPSLKFLVVGQTDIGKSRKLNARWRWALRRRSWARIPSGRDPTGGWGRSRDCH